MYSIILVFTLPLHNMAYVQSPNKIQCSAFRKRNEPLTSIFSSAKSDVLKSQKTNDVTPYSFIDEELRGAAMKLHTKKQSPKEGQKVEPKEVKPYTPTIYDYLAFLVDSQYAYATFEEIVNSNEELSIFRKTGLERTASLETDITYLIEENDLIRPPVGPAGLKYAEELRQIKDDIPQFVCHFYNYYFAHTAGGRMIGKKMSSLLLDNKKLEFYKWQGNLNEMKSTVKLNIENMVGQWTQEEKNECVDATADVFRGSGMLNKYLFQGRES